MAEQFKLRDLPLFARLAVICLCAVFGVGLLASLQHMRWHHEKRDERPGLTVDDIQGAYHGIRSKSPLVTALERGHPENLKPAHRDALSDWLMGKKDAQGNRPATGNPRLSSDYDNPDLGELAPIEIIASSCLECHSRAAADKHPIAKIYPLNEWNDIKGIATSREINPTDPKKLAISIHAHALGLGAMAFAIGAMFWFSRGPRQLIAMLLFISTAGLLADFVGQVVARQQVWAVWLIVIGGGAFNGLSGLMILWTSFDMILPCRKTQ